MSVMLPAGLETAFGVLGVPWPTEDEDRLRECAEAYRACAAALTADVTPAAHAAVTRVADDNAGDHVDALTAFWSDYHHADAGHLPSLAVTLTALGDGHDAAAKLVAAVKTLLVTLAAYLLAALLWAAAAAVWTGGAAALQARTAVGALRLAARRATAAFRREFERFFGQRLVEGVETRLGRILGARRPALPGTNRGVLDRLRDTPRPNTTIGELRGFTTQEVDGSLYSRAKSERIHRLTDRNLLRSLFNPANGMYVQAYRDSRRFVNGSHRVVEMRVRASKGGSLITEDTPIYVHFLPG